MSEVGLDDRTAVQKLNTNMLEVLNCFHCMMACFTLSLLSLLKIYKEKDL